VADRTGEELQVDVGVLHVGVAARLVEPHVDAAAELDRPLIRGLMALTLDSSIIKGSRIDSPFSSSRFGTVEGRAIPINVAPSSMTTVSGASVESCST